jgi:hypothetical protein
MRACLALLLALAALPAAAQQPGDDTGLVLGLRAGYGAPFGEVESDGAPVRDVVSSKIPIWLELGYRFSARLQGEIFFELAPASVRAGLCAGDASCEASDARFGIVLQLHLAPHGPIDPWLGVGVALELLRAEVVDPGGGRPPGRYDWTWAGLELPILEAGLDVRVSRRLTLGPYVSASLGEFTSFSERPEGGPTTSGSIDEREPHGWIQGGLKGTLRL